MTKEINPVERKISMVAAASGALAYRKKNPAHGSDKVLQYSSMNVAIRKDECTKMGMIAAATKAITMAEKQPSLQEKEIIRRVISSIPNMLENIG